MSVSFEDFVDGNDFTVSGSSLVLSLHLVPESGSCDNWVLSEDSHSVESWFWVGISWESSTNDPILSNLYD